MDMKIQISISVLQAETLATFEQEKAVKKQLELGVLIIIPLNTHVQGF